MKGSKGRSRVWVFANITHLRHPRLAMTGGVVDHSLINAASLKNHYLCVNDYRTTLHVEF